MNIYDMRIQYTVVKAGENVRLNTSERLVSYMLGAFDDDPTCEWFCVIPTDQKLNPVGRMIINKGNAISTQVNVAGLFKAVILASAPAMFIVHNHPSGDPAPSKADRLVTGDLVRAARLLQIRLVDHVVIGTPEADPKGVGYYSFQENDDLIYDQSRHLKRSIERKVKRIPLITKP